MDGITDPTANPVILVAAPTASHPVFPAATKPKAFDARQKVFATPRVILVAGRMRRAMSSLPRAHPLTQSHIWHRRQEAAIGSNVGCPHARRTARPQQEVIVLKIKREREKSHLSIAM